MPVIRESRGLCVFGSVTAFADPATQHSYRCVANLEEPHFISATRLVSVEIAAARPFDF